MSRTYRRKNYEIEDKGSWRGGGKIAGYYTEYKFHYGKVTKENIDNIDIKDIYYSKYSNCYYFQFITYHAPTKEEYFYKWYWAHGESRSSRERGPAKYHRNFRIRQNRNINKNEIRKYFNDQNYEPMCEEKVRSCMWDWS